MSLIIITSILSFFVSVFLTPVIRRFAIDLKVFASPNHRSVHASPIPKLGGISIFMGFAIAMLAPEFFGLNTQTYAFLLAGGSVALLVGIYDDIRGMNCYLKLLGQAVAALIAVQAGFVISTIYLPFGIIWHPGVWAIPFTVAWIVTITNAVNLLDGLDGLASGFSIVVGVFVIFAAFLVGDLELIMVALMLVAASLGFLKHNFAPAKIFMGDSGSLFLGFALACLSLRVFTVPAGGSHLLVMLLLFFVPLADTSISIFRRVSQGRHPFSADKKHIHHRLLELGLSQAHAVLVLYGATLLSGIVALVLFIANIYLAIALITIYLVAFMMALVQLGCFDFLYKRKADFIN